ncbi:bifunctional (p)ppGpp synthetase/guanosine-3',5'-bis(diphosphate) 3'-pyrophosphohydrolase [Candidatus Peregrinibacteria bacterium]|nr:bifunctional (p)ppGpp synthetase/guanosine-3',5'-bis(diphosphate) 3'-pyrophosphohydrolase [Candidatus Peregrinibacteria bacterium]
MQRIFHKAQEKAISLKKDRIEAAFRFCESLLPPEKIEEGVEVAEILLDFFPDESTCIAGILSGTLSIDPAPFPEIEKLFGGDISRILCDLHKLKILSSLATKNPENQIELLRKMFLALAKDVRVVVIKLAMRLSSLRHMESLSLEQKKQYAGEVLDLYAPIAGRLGIFRIKTELEDLAFAYLYPKEFTEISAQITALRNERGAVLERGEKEILTLLKEAGIQGEVQGRMKETYSIFQKLRKKQKSSIEYIYDIFAFRVLLSSIAECYTLLGHIHQKWPVIGDRFKDYITNPKPNGYRALHTTIRASFENVSEEHPLEIQIKTHEMHRNSEFGSATHWWYKEKGSNVPLKDNWLLQLTRIEKQIHNMENFELFTEGLLEDFIFTLTENGDVKILPSGATPLDFAFSVHTDIGYHYQSALVNGKIVPIDYRLEQGDVVKIIPNKNSFPRESWVSLVSSNQAKQRIRAFLRKENFEEFLKKGKKLLNESLARYGVQKLDAQLSSLKNLFKGQLLAQKEREDIVLRVGNGSLRAHIIARKLVQNIEGEKIRPLPDENFQKSFDNEGVGIIVTGEKGFRFRKANCCMPDPSAPIVAFTTRGGTLTLHRRECKMLQKLDSNRFLPARWETDPFPFETYIALVERHKFDRPLPKISKIFALMGVHILSIHYSESVQKKTLFFHVEIPKKDDLPHIFSALTELPEIIDVREISEEETPFALK